MQSCQMPTATKKLQEDDGDDDALKM